MPVLDKTKHNWVDDRDDTKYIGLKLPLILDNGQEASTATTLQAVKQNILNLLNTELGERLMHPNLGVQLKRFLFEPFSETVGVEIQDVIVESVNYWLPFLLINNIDIKMSNSERSTMEILIDFSLKKDPNVNESISLTVGE